MHIFMSIHIINMFGNLFIHSYSNLSQRSVSLFAKGKLAEPQPRSGSVEPVVGGLHLLVGRFGRFLMFPCWLEKGSTITNKTKGQNKNSTKHTTTKTNVDPLEGRGVPHVVARGRGVHRDHHPSRGEAAARQGEEKGAWGKWTYV